MDTPDSLAQGVFVYRMPDINIYEKIAEDLNRNIWSDAAIRHPDCGSMVDRDYRNASVIGASENQTAIEQLESQARSIFFPHFATLGPFGNLGIEGSQFVRYQQGGFFKAHRDAGYDYKLRCFTLLCYMTNCEGGDTVFPELSLSISPEKGLWLAFYSEYLHAALPVTSGEKIVFVTWAVGQ